jgi:hypothetical protein
VQNGGTEGAPREDGPSLKDKVWNWSRVMKLMSFQNRNTFEKSRNYERRIVSKSAESFRNYAGRKYCVLDILYSYRILFYLHARRQARRR